MSQKLKIGGASASGIIGVLFIMGLVVYVTGIDTALGETAMAAAIGIGIVYGLLGAAGIAKRQGW